jgi:hypothetical protein
VNFLWFGRRLHSPGGPNRSGAAFSLSAFRRQPPIAFPSRTACSCGHQPFHYTCARSILTPSSRPPPVIHLLHSGLDVHVLSSVAFWLRSQPRHDAHHVASKRVANAGISTVNVIYPFVFGYWWSCTWRPHGQDTGRRCGLGRPNCTSRSTTFALMGILTSSSIGRYSLDAHPPHDHIIWHAISCRHGPWGI